MKQKVVTMNISLPATLRGALEKKLERQSYGTASEYVRDLIRKDLQREAIAQVDELLLEGINSGPATPMTDEDWQELRTLAGRRPSPAHGSKKTGAAPHRAA
jgi:antitoxin ParD1/3/4